MALQSLLGVLVLLALAWAISEDRRAVSIRRIAVGLAVTVALAALLLKIPQTKVVFAALNQGVDAVAAATRAGTAFVFGYLGGAPLPFDPKMPGGEYVLAFQALPIVLVVSVLTTLLFHWGVLQVVVRGFACHVAAGMVVDIAFLIPILARLHFGGTAPLARHLLA